jgi:hypothetical protein
MCEDCGCHDHQHTHLLLKITGLKNAHDAAALEAALNQLTGIHANVDFDLSAVSLLLHDDSDLAEAKNLIINAGYQV